MRAAEESRLSEEEAGRRDREGRPAEAEVSDREAERSRRLHEDADGATRRPGDPATRRPGDPADYNGSLSSRCQAPARNNLVRRVVRSRRLRDRRSCPTQCNPYRVHGGHPVVSAPVAGRAAHSAHAGRASLYFQSTIESGLMETQDGARVDRDGDTPAGARRRSVTGDGGNADSGRRTRPVTADTGTGGGGAGIVAMLSRSDAEPGTGSSRHRSRRTRQQCGALPCRTPCMSQCQSLLSPLPVLTIRGSRSASQPVPSLACSGNCRSNATLAEALNRLPAIFRHRGWTPISHGLADAS